MLKRGALIVLEGCDRVGKSTHARLLSEALKEEELKIESLQFPDRSTPIGEIINQYLTGSEEVEDHAIHLLFSANRWEQVKSLYEFFQVNLVANYIRDIKAMQCVGPDFTGLFSNWVLEIMPDITSKNYPKMLRLLNSGVSLIVDRYAYSGVAFSYAKKGLNFSWCKQSDVGLPKPDLVLFLDLASEAMAKRSGFGEERYEKEDFQSEVKKVYGLLREDNWKVINTDREINDVQQEIKQLVKDTINNISSNTCDTLWTDNFETYV